MLQETSKREHPYITPPFISFEFADLTRSFVLVRNPDPYLVKIVGKPGQVSPNTHSPIPQGGSYHPSSSQPDFFPQLDPLLFSDPPIRPTSSTKTLPPFPDGSPLFSLDVLLPSATSQVSRLC